MMEFDKPENLTLGTIGGGAAVEKFGIELESVIKNIKDVNFPSADKRVINIKITLKPSKDRNYCTTEIDCDSKLAKRNSFTSGMYVGFDEEGQAIANENMPKQTTFADLGSTTKIHELKEAK